MRILKRVLTVIIAVAMVLSTQLINISSVKAATEMVNETFDADLGGFAATKGSVTVVKDGEYSVMKVDNNSSAKYVVDTSDSRWSGSYSMTIRIKMDDWAGEGALFQLSTDVSQSDHKYLLTYNAYGFNFVKMNPPYIYTMVVNPTGLESVNAAKYHTIKYNVVRDIEDGTATVTVYFDGVRKITYTDTDNVCKPGDFFIERTNAKGSLLIDSVVVVPLGTEDERVVNGGIPTPDVEHSDYEKEATVLRDLGVLENESNGMWDGDRVVTRAEYVSALLKLMGYNKENIFKNDAYTFKDVDAKRSESSEISLAYALGIVSDDTNGYFRPDEAVTYSDAQIMAVRALGYKRDAESKGGNPAGYNKVAAQLGLPKAPGVKNASKKDIALLLFECLTIPVKEQIAWGKDYVEFATAGETFLSQRDIVTGTGKITGNYVTSIDSTERFDRGYVKIDNGIYKEGSTLAADYLGCDVEYYAFEDKYGEKTLLYAAPSNNNNIRIFETDDISSTTKRKLVYTDDDGKKKELSISSAVDVIYNGMLLDDFAKEQLKPAYGHIRVIDNNDDNIADVIFVYDFDVLAAESISVNAGVVYDSLTADGKLILSAENGKCVDIVKNGVKASIKDISQGDVVSYYISKDGYYRCAYVSSKRVGGIVEENSHTKNTIKVGGNEYELSKRFIDAVSSGKELSAAAGSEYTFLLDVFGRVVSIAESSYHSGAQYAFVRNMAKEGVFNITYKFEIFNQNGEWQELKLRDKVRWNGGNNISVSEFITNSGMIDESGAFKPQLIEYTTDADGNAVTVKTAVNRSEAADPTNMLCLDNSAKLRYISANKSLHSRYFISGVKIFIIPNDLNNEDFYRVGSTGDLYSGSTYQAEIYNEVNAIPGVVVIRTDDNYSSDPGKLKPFFVVSSTGMSYNAETKEISHNMTGLYSGESSIIEFVDDAVLSNVGKGDIIQYTLNPNGKVVSAAIRCDADNIAYGDDGGFNGNMRAITGKIAHINKKNKIVGINIADSTAVTDDTLWISLDKSNITYYVYDKAIGEVMVGSMDDLDKGADICVRLVQESVNELVIYTE